VFSGGKTLTAGPLSEGEVSGGGLFIERWEAWENQKEEEMNEAKCPSCNKTVMSPKELERLIKSASGNILLSHCSCGEALEIRLLADGFSVMATPGKRKKEDKEQEGRVS